MWPFTRRPTQDETENAVLRNKADRICAVLREISSGQRQATPEERAAMRRALGR